MIASEVLQLCRLVKACCPSQTFDQYTPDAWGLILGRFAFEDAKLAVAAMVSAPLDPGKSRYLEPGHIIGGIMRLRNTRLQSTAFPEPPAGLDALEYSEWAGYVREAIAGGTYQAEPQKALDAALEAMPGRVEAYIREAKRGMPQMPTSPAAQPERRAAINDEAAERERARQLAALDAMTA